MQHPHSKPITFHFATNINNIFIVTKLYTKILQIKIETKKAAPGAAFSIPILPSETITLSSYRLSYRFLPGIAV